MNHLQKRLKKPLQLRLKAPIMGIADGTATFCIIAAYRQAEPSNLSPFEFYGIQFSFCLGWMSFVETPFDRLIPGVF